MWNILGKEMRKMCGENRFCKHFFLLVVSFSSFIAISLLLFSFTALPLYRCFVNFMFFKYFSQFTTCSTFMLSYIPFYITFSIPFYTRLFVLLALTALLFFISFILLYFSFFLQDFSVFHFSAFSVFISTFLIFFSLALIFYFV